MPKKSLTQPTQMSLPREKQRAESSKQKANAAREGSATLRKGPVTRRRTSGTHSPTIRK
jgi:hypothetical protein